MTTHRPLPNISINIIANGVIGHQGLSGGDNIFINFAKNFIDLGIKVNVFTWQDGYLMCRKNGLTKANFILTDAEKYKNLPFPIFFWIRSILGIKAIHKALGTDLFNKNKVILYSASDFAPDFLPALYLKIRLKSVRWFAGFYLFAPNPFRGFRGVYRDKINFPKIKDFFYWLMQKPTFCLIRKMADVVCVTSQPDVAKFVSKKRTTSNIFVVKGGIDYQEYVNFQKSKKKIYDGVYLGRFHPQKGVLEMIDIWEIVVRRRPTSLLAFIGLGELESEMKDKIKKLGLQKNIKFFGPLLGDKRNQILQQSKIIVHPAVYDSGGMAAASGLACGLPGVSFDLPVFKSYYKKGFLRAKIGDFNGFADIILSLLTDQDKYQKMKKEAIKESKTWDWSNRTDEFLSLIKTV